MPRPHARRTLIARLSLCTLLSIHGSVIAAQAQQGRVKALVGGTLIDGNGGPPLRNSVIVIQGERIAAVGAVGSITIPAGAEVVPTEGMSVLQGLWDMHVHLMLGHHCGARRRVAPQRAARGCRCRGAARCEAQVNGS